MHEHRFDRFVRAIDNLVGQGIIKDVFIQTGHSKYQPKNCEWSNAIDFIEFEQLMGKADIIISHGGAGCIAGALERSKPIVVVPRLKKYNEHFDDHQLELASVLEKSGRALVAYDIKDLAQLIEKAQHFKPKPTTGNSQIVKIIRDYLINTARKKGMGFNNIVNIS
jgi:UDP-N-acetylglucosamine transferase subunit ALG13